MSKRMSVRIEAVSSSTASAMRPMSAPRLTAGTVCSAAGRRARL